LVREQGFPPSLLFPGFTSLRLASYELRTGKPTYRLPVGRQGRQASHPFLILSPQFTSRGWNAVEAKTGSETGTILGHL